MEETLQLKRSPFLLVSTIIIWLLILVSIAFLIFGIFDFRSDEQKITDERNELISQTTFQRGVTALKYLHKNQNSLIADDVSEIISVSCIKSSTYALIVYKDNLNNTQELTYDEKSKRGYKGDDLYYQTVASLAAKDMYLGSKKDSYTVQYKGEELLIMLEETGLKWR